MLSKYKSKINILIGLIMGFIYYLIVRLTGITIPCLLFDITGLYCPGCGITRAAMALSRLEFYQSFRYNSMLFIVPPILLIEWYLKNKGRTKASSYILIILTVIVLCYGVLRNFDMFYFLRPTVI